MCIDTVLEHFVSSGKVTNGIVLYTWFGFILKLQPKKSKSKTPWSGVWLCYIALLRRVAARCALLPCAITFCAVDTQLIYSIIDCDDVPLFDWTTHRLRRINWITSVDATGYILSVYHCDRCTIRSSHNICTSYRHWPKPAIRENRPRISVLHLSAVMLLWRCVISEQLIVVGMRESCRWIWFYAACNGRDADLDCALWIDADTTTNTIDILFHRKLRLNRYGDRLYDRIVDLKYRRTPF